MTTYFVTGISTDVGKTIVSAILTEALQANYWKPIQAGELNNTDTHSVKQLISNTISQFHESAYRLKSPMSPHAAASIDGLEIDLKKIISPKPKNNLIIEGAGGLLVPLNNTQTIFDIIKPSYKIIVVSRHYLGSINHTLLTLKYLTERGFDVSLVYNGNENKHTETIIEKMTATPVIGRVANEPYFDKNVIKEYAEIFKEKLT